MPRNLFNNAEQWARGKLRAHASGLATYQRGGNTAQIYGTLSPSSSATVNGQHLAVQSDGFDFVLHDASELVLGGVVSKPESGDGLTVGGVTYRVIARDNGACWRPSGTGTAIRIHLAVN